MHRASIMNIVLLRHKKYIQLRIVLNVHFLQRKLRFGMFASFSFLHKHKQKQKHLQILCTIEISCVQYEHWTAVRGVFMLYYGVVYFVVIVYTLRLRWFQTIFPKYWHAFAIRCHATSTCYTYLTVNKSVHWLLWCLRSEFSINFCIWSFAFVVVSVSSYSTNVSVYLVHCHCHFSIAITITLVLFFLLLNNIFSCVSYKSFLSKLTIWDKDLMLRMVGNFSPPFWILT